MRRVNLTCGNGCANLDSISLNMGHINYYKQIFSIFLQSERKKCNIKFDLNSNSKTCLNNLKKNYFSNFKTDGFLFDRFSNDLYHSET